MGKGAIGAAFLDSRRWVGATLPKVGACTMRISRKGRETRTPNI